MRPPEHIAPDQLFRLLTSTPRPSLPIDFTFAGLPVAALEVVALTTREVASAADDAELVATSLRVDGARLFASASDVSDLPLDTWLALAAAWRKTFLVVSPRYHACDWKAWKETLINGASHITNCTTAGLLGSAYEVHGTRLIERPERFFGLPPCDLTDGQMMAYRAARTLHEREWASRS